MRYLLLFLYSSYLFSEITPIQFSHWMDKYADDSVQVPSIQKHQEKNVHYFLVCGFFNEISNCYFDKNVQELLACGVAKENIHVVRLQSGKPDEYNARLLFDAMSLVPGKKVIIAHSRGGPVTALLSYEEKQYFSQNVVAIFSIQGAYGGSDLADSAVGTASALAKMIPLPKVQLTRFVPTAVTGFIQNKATQMMTNAGSGLTGLMTVADTRGLQNKLENDAEWMRNLSPRFYYIRSRINMSQASISSKATKLVMAISAGSLDLTSDDGAVRVEHQKMSVGCALALFEGIDHSGLTSHKTGPYLVRQLMRSIYTGVDSLL